MRFRKIMEKDILGLEINISDKDLESGSAL
jgi:hypothetical protein